MQSPLQLLQLSFRLGASVIPLAPHLVQAMSTIDGAMYNVFYRIERRGSEYWAVLERVEETMPPRTPQISTFTDQDRLPMRDMSEEVEQRRLEWADVNSKMEA